MRGLPEAVEVLAERQRGAVTRRQLTAAGVTGAQLRHRVESGRWQRFCDGVFVGFSGPVPPLTRVWALLLACGTPSVAGRRTALWLAGVLDGEPPSVHVVVPADRRIRPPSGVTLQRRRDFDRLVCSAADPPRTTVEVACLDVAATAASVDAAVGPLIAAVQRRVTTPQRLRTELAARHRHPRRGLLSEVLDDVAAGAQSALELRYLRDVERAHGLPTGVRNRPEPGPRGTTYRDVRYPQYGTVAELDGRLAHQERFRDWRRDNGLAVDGVQTLRYGWQDVAGRPCDVAAQLAAVLTLSGWTGRTRRCRRCP